MGRWNFRATGNDHDSYAQLLGAFVGALYGDELFRPEWRQVIASRLQADYGEDIDEWTEVLLKASFVGMSESLIRYE